MPTHTIPSIGKRRRQARFLAMPARPLVALASMVILAIAASVSTLSSVEAFVGTAGFSTYNKCTSLCMSTGRQPTGSTSLKPAATPMMDAGKAVARSGELLIDLTKALDLYGGALSAAGANIRNSGDCLAQAAASCRFKTAREIVIDELREAATCLTEATDKLNLAVEEAAADKDPKLEGLVRNLVGPTNICASKLEESGMRIMIRDPLYDVGGTIVEASQGFELLAKSINQLSEESNQNADGILSAQRMTFASERLEQAGIELKDEVDNSKKNQGRAFLKGGGF